MGTTQSSDYGFDDHDGEAGWGPDFRLTDPFLLDFLNVAKGWTSSHQGPDETKVDLLDAVRFLPLVFWYNLQPDKSWVCRFFGSEIVGVRGNDPTQLPLDYSSDNIADRYVGAFLNLVVTAGEAVSTESQSVIKGREYLRTQSVGLPVFADDGMISGVIGAQVFYRPDGKSE
ncbi:MAG: hypothetical protein P1U69_05915 [Parvibaculaceae bacterium]|nr:hypothetical protein [Parvibaculaceae bacterium]